MFSSFSIFSHGSQKFTKFHTSPTTSNHSIFEHAEESEEYFYQVLLVADVQIAPKSTIHMKSAQKRTIALQHITTIYNGISFLASGIVEFTDFIPWYLACFSGEDGSPLASWTLNSRDRRTEGQQIAPKGSLQSLIITGKTENCGNNM